MSATTPSFEQIHAQLTNLCRSGGMEQPDLIVDTLDGEFAAIWLESKTVVVIGEEEESDRPNPVQDLDFIEVAESILGLCDDNDFPRPDGAVYDSARGKIQFVWTDEFDATWDIEPLLASIRDSGVKARPVGDQIAGERLH
jgi:hypothetical protein